MRNLIKNKNFYLILILDSFLIAVSYLFSYLLRFEGQIPPQEWTNLKSTILPILILKIFVFYRFNLYKGMWRYTSLTDSLNVLKATVISSAIIILGILFIYRFQGFPRSIFIVDGAFTFIFIGGLRIAVRLFFSEKEKTLYSLFQFNPFTNNKKEGTKKKRLLIVGAGDAGEKMLREIRDNTRLNYEVMGFIDDNPKKKGMMIHGVPVLGGLSIIKSLASLNTMDEILIATPSASATKMRKIIQACDSTGLKYRTTPGIGELINGKVSFKSTREVTYEDLLGRNPVDLDINSIGNYLSGKNILITGAAGSIGSELCRQIVQFAPNHLIFLDKTENNLYHLEMEFRQLFPDVSFTPLLGDVKYKIYLNRLFSDYKPEVVFHAAAYKHVPVVELNPWEAIFNNVVGTKNLIEVSHQHGADHFIMISTDKAVRPVNVMGATKRIAEMITSWYGSNGNCFVSVRFGNVIGSEGSVIHLFKKQIERLGPLTVTHPEITRYFMTISEACKLILQAGAMGKGGEMFILNMGIPIKISQMARDLIQLSGFDPDVDIPIKYIGLRPGEKLYEELITEGEGIVRTPHGKIYVLKGNCCDLDWLNQKIEELVALSHEQDAKGIKMKLKEIVPEYQPYLP